MTAVALVLELIIDVIAVAAGNHGQLGVRQRSFMSVDLPEGSVPVPDVIDQPGGSVAHLVNQRVS